MGQETQFKLPEKVTLSTEDYRKLIRKDIDSVELIKTMQSVLSKEKLTPLLSWLSNEGKIYLEKYKDQ